MAANSQPQLEVQSIEFEIVKSGVIAPDEVDVIRVLIVGENDVVSQTLATSLVTLGFDAATSSDWASTDLTSPLTELQPTVVILRATPATINERLRLMPRLSATGAAVLVLSEPLSAASCEAINEAGVAGVLSTSDSIDRVLDAVQVANTLGREPTKEPVVSALPGRAHPPAKRFDELTPVEAAVLQRLADGLSPAQIAAERYVAVSTVRSQLKAIYRKLGVRSQLAAVAAARERAAKATA